MGPRKLALVSEGAPRPDGHPALGSASLFHEALSTLRAGFLLLDENGRPVSEVDPVLVDLGISDLSPQTLERIRQRAVDENGKPLPPDYTPVFDAIFRDIPMNDVVLGLRLDDFADADDPGLTFRGTVPERGFRWVRLNSRRLVVDGMPRVLVTAVDVTQVREGEDRRRELEAAVAAEQRRFAVMFEHIGDLITVFDVNGEVLFGSPSGERILGWPLGYRSEGGILGLVHPDDRSAAAAALAGLVDGTRGPTEAIILRVRTAWGDWRYLECVGVNMLEEPSIEGIVVTARDVSERHRLTLALEHAATHDQLTGLPNRAMFSAHLTAALSRAERRESSSALCYIDVDGFKHVNDRYGHGVGDLLLEDVARRIRECLRPSDVPSRLGGDEFALVLEGVDAKTAVNVARRLGDHLQTPFDLAGTTLTCSASIGVALARTGDTAEKWLARADSALYEAKRAGGRVVRLGAPSGDASLDQASA
jgi:diguanylate cyclase (GGDEF)-like protein/PAS domain S-box-containing protein